MSESVSLLRTREDLHNPIDYKEQFWRYPTEFNDETNPVSSTKADDSNQSRFVKYAEIILKYNVIEFRHHPNGTEFPVLTLLLFIVFTASDDNDLDLKSCKYRISWTGLFNGYIQRLCENANETVFKKIAFFKGNPDWGLTFSSVDEKINYGYSIKSSFGICLKVIPTLYTAYYDLLNRERDRQYEHDSVSPNGRPDQGPVKIRSQSQFLPSTIH
ncbi:4027_t:CDS:2 [Dentiscutata heterogama]|uniref:4027_t:CDS:1 n=1 Tax=Dentiscutata heterogama TaxID=1316150 RepID=A0ACA9KWR8_9GLOM|nr:4027_t:CDS:2 [Dentiscutata heterogama]